ncbi:MAG: hypothetical protein QM755_23720 [Luteolibacter sp.]
MSKITLLDIAKLNGSAKEVGLIESVMTAAPELATFPARTVNGTSFRTVDRSALPNTGFTKANAGITPGKSKFTTKLVECFIFRGSVAADKAVCDAYEDGAPAYQAIEAEGVMRSAAINVGKQIYYGTDTDASGFPGLQSIVALQGSAMTVDATGTTASTGSSVYAVKFGPQFVQMIYGSGKGLKLDPFRVQTMTDDNGGNYSAYVSELTAWVGLQCVHPYAVGRIKNLTADSGKGLTDALLSDLLAKFPVGFTPDAIFMTRRSRKQLQTDRASKTALRGTGKNDLGGGSAYAPTPTDYEGIPIICTDSILDTEAIA